jgi:uncharacterized Fe-S cluster protein YjdI/CDGSH-type Zn-finger protein
MESKTYTNNDITVTWQPSKCVHSAVCFKGLPRVFNPNKKPWITLSNSDTARIIKQIDQCPSGAISYVKNHETENSVSHEAHQEGLIKIKVTPAGPLLIQGNFLLERDENTALINSKITAFCRCGHSKNKPYCDGSHRNIEFDNA